MASIRKRIAKGCVTESFQVQIRRSGVRSFTITFSSYEDALSWVEKNERKYINNPESYDHLRNTYQGERLNHLRDVHFAKRGLK